MGIYSLKNIRNSNSNTKRSYLFELEVNGQTIDDDDDYTIQDNNEEGDEGDNNPQSPEDIANQAATDTTGDEDDYTITPDDEPAEGGDDTTDVTVQADDDYTIPDDDTAANDAPQQDDQPAATTDDNANVEDGVPDDTDGTTDADNQQQADPDSPQNAGGGQVEDDFTIDGDDVGGGEGDEGTGEGDEGGMGDSGGSSDDDSITDPSQEIADEEQKNAEEELYSSLTSDQRRIRSLYLKTNFKNLYEEYRNVIAAINDITKTADNIDILKRTTSCMLKNKDNLVSYMSDIYDTSAYIDNFANYIKFVAILRTVTKVLNKLNEDKNAKK